MPEHDPEMRGAIGTRCEAIFLRLLAIHLGPHIIGDPHPPEKHHDQKEHEEAGDEKCRHDDDDIKEGKRSPDFNKSLGVNIEFSGKIALQGADYCAEDLGKEHEHKGKENGHAEPVENPGEHIASLGVCAEPVAGVRGIGRGIRVKSEIVLIGIEGDKGQENQVLCPFELFFHGAIIRLRIVESPFILLSECDHGIKLERWKIKFPVIANKDRAVIGDEV